MADNLQQMIRGEDAGEVVSHTMDGIGLHNSLPPCGTNLKAIRVRANAGCWIPEIGALVCFNNHNVLKVLGASKGCHQTGEAATIGHYSHSITTYTSVHIPATDDNSRP